VGDRHLLLAERLEVVLEFGPPVGVEDRLPAGRVIELPEIGGDLAGQQPYRRRLPDAVRAEHPGHVPVLGDREPVQPEGVLAVAVGGLFLEFLGEVDDLDGVERTLLDADPTGLAQAEFLGDRDLVGVAVERFVLAVAFLSGDDALLAGAVGRTEVRTLVVAPVGLAPVEVDDGDGVVGHYAVSSIAQLTNHSENVMNVT